MFALIVLIILARLVFRPWGYRRPYGMFWGGPRWMHRPPMGGFGPGFGPGFGGPPMGGMGRHGFWL